MEILNYIIKKPLKKRILDIEYFKKHPIEVQERILKTMLAYASNTEFGKKYDFKNITSYSKFKNRIPIHTYEKLFPFIEKMMRGKQNILWPSKIKWFSKSSGTTNARSKFIPVSTESLNECHYKGGKDLISLYINEFPETKMFTGRNLAIGGSYQINENDITKKSRYGDISAIIMKNLPVWAQYVRTPSLKHALMGNWEEKIEKMALESSKKNITSISGIPTWTYILLQHILNMGKKKNILDIWPNLEVFFHGAVSFTPYKELFKNITQGEMINYWETYNASEGFFGIQDQKNSDEMLLMLNYGIFYEFIPYNQIHNEHPETITLENVHLDENYAMIITTNSGLWRYNIGDTVRFTSLKPFRIKISGRTKHFINTFGEELIIENAEMGISDACLKTNSIIDNYTAGPIYFNEGRKGRHEWIIEFSKKPENIELFVKLLDKKLREVNSDYDAKRKGNLALQLPIVHSVKQGTFYEWMKRRGKLGGQNKVPRLSNNREYLDDIIKFI